MNKRFHSAPAFQWPRTKRGCKEVSGITGTAPCQDSEPSDWLPHQGLLAPVIQGGYKSATGLNVSYMVLHTYCQGLSTFLGIYSDIRVIFFPASVYLPWSWRATHFSCASSSQMLVAFSSRYVSKQNLASASSQIISFTPLLDFIRIPLVVDIHLQDKFRVVCLSSHAVPINI